MAVCAKTCLLAAFCCRAFTSPPVWLVMSVATLMALPMKPRFILSANKNYIVQSIKRNLYIFAPTCARNDISTICRPLIRYKWTCQRKHYAKIERKVARQVHKKPLKYELYCIHTPVYIWLTFHFVVWLLWFSLVCLLTAHGTNSIDGSDLTAGDICGVGDVYGEYSHWGSRDRVA